MSLLLRCILSVLLAKSSDGAKKHAPFEAPIKKKKGHGNQDLNVSFAARPDHIHMRCKLHGRLFFICRFTYVGKGHSFRVLRQQTDIIILAANFVCVCAKSSDLFDREVDFVCWPAGWTDMAA